LPKLHFSDSNSNVARCPRTGDNERFKKSKSREIIGRGDEERLEAYEERIRGKEGRNIR
jgi:hypothetical protein